MPPGDRFYGLRDYRVKDLNGYELGFGHRSGPLDDGPPEEILLHTDEPLGDGVAGPHTKSDLKYILTPSASPRDRCAADERYIGRMTLPALTADEIIALLDHERAAFLAQVGRMPAPRQAQRPAPDRWSVTEIVEHVARIDLGVGKLLALRTAEPVLASAQQLADAEFTPERIHRVRNREERIEAPERVRPTGTLSPAAALAHLATSRAALKTAFLAADPAVLDGVVHPHPVIGLLTLRGWVALAAHHDARHAKQVAEIVEE